MDVVVSLKIRDSLVGLQKTVFIWKKTASGLKCTIGKRTAVDRAISFVPRNEPFKETEVGDLKRFLDASDRILVMTGAGVSTESGIPDYRSEGVGLYARSPDRPIQYQKFVADTEARRRYWARNFVGWPRFSSTYPNATHTALRDLFRHKGKTGYIVTQNVDRLHHKAGSERVIELHGTAFEVICLSCGQTGCRHQLQLEIQAENPHLVPMDVEVRPDGDVHLESEMVERFRPPHCKNCGGILKPNIVFFGDNVPRKIVEDVNSELRASDALLVLGSSLQVFSGYRFALQAKELGIPIAIINIGPTRADHLADFKISRRCGPFLEKLISLL